jgi:hypothetical protein
LPQQCDASGLILIHDQHQQRANRQLGAEWLKCTVPRKPAVNATAIQMPGRS